MGQLIVGFALGWLTFTKEGKEVAEKLSAVLMQKDEKKQDADKPES